MERKEVKEKQAKYYRERLRTDELFRLKQQVCKNINSALKRFSTNKSQRSVNYLGCSIIEYKSYLESKFEDWMSWSNYGRCKFGEVRWHIDHIIPLSRFNLMDIEERKKAFHYTNTAPLEAIANIKKGNKIL